MRNLFILLTLTVFTSNVFSQTKNFIDQAYLETSVEVDTLIAPDRIYLSIILNESDNRNKRSTEDLERSMEQVLRGLNIDVEKDLSLLDFSSDFKKYFLSSQKVLKTKMYSLRVTSAYQAGQVLAELEKKEISNVSVEKTEYSKSEELMLYLKSRAILKAKEHAESMVAPLNQKVGKAIYISDARSIANHLQGKTPGIVIRGSSSMYGSSASKPLAIEFKKMNFGVKVNVKFKIE